MDSATLDYADAQPLDFLPPVYPAAEASELLFQASGLMLQPEFRSYLLPEQMTADQWFALTSPREERESYSSETKLLHAYLHQVYDKLEQSDAVNSLQAKVKQGEELTAADFTAAYRAYENALRSTFQVMKPSLSRPQRNVLQELITHLDWNIKDDIAADTMLLQSGEVELQHDPSKIIRLLNRKIRRIDYLTVDQARQDIRRFGSQLDRQQLKDAFREPARQAKLEEALANK